jgi:hypothetical protein
VKNDGFYDLSVLSWENGFHAARFKGFSGTMPSQRSGRKGNCLSASARVLPLQRSETMHGRKRFMSANEAPFQTSRLIFCEYQE